MKKQKNQDLILNVLNFNKTYELLDISVSEKIKVETLEKYIDKKYFNNKNERIRIYMCKVKEKDIIKEGFLPFECIKIGNLLIQLQLLIKERTQQDLFPFYFYIRKKEEKV